MDDSVDCCRVCGAAAVYSMPKVGGDNDDWAIVHICAGSTVLTAIVAAAAVVVELLVSVCCLLPDRLLSRRCCRCFSLSWLNTECARVSCMGRGSFGALGLLIF